MSGTNFIKKEFEQVMGINQFDPDPDPQFQFLYEHGARLFATL